MRVMSHELVLFFFFVYWQFANRLGQYCHLLYLFKYTSVLGKMLLMPKSVSGKKLFITIKKLIQFKWMFFTKARRHISFVFNVRSHCRISSLTSHATQRIWAQRYAVWPAVFRQTIHFFPALCTHQKSFNCCCSKLQSFADNCSLFSSFQPVLLHVTNTESDRTVWVEKKRMKWRVLKSIRTLHLWADLLVLL